MRGDKVIKQKKNSAQENCYNWVWQNKQVWKGLKMMLLQTGANQIREYQRNINRVLRDQRASKARAKVLKTI